jgi:hypothetical protein
LHNLQIAHCHFVRELLLAVRLDTHAEAKPSCLWARSLILGFLSRPPGLSQRQKIARSST